MSAEAGSDPVTALTEAPWGRATVLVQLSLFAIPAITDWTATLGSTALIPLVALPLTLCVGIALLLSRVWRRAGGRIILGTLVAAVLEVALTFLLVLAYSSANPGWDLS
jgi:hypothetical protein